MIGRDQTVPMAACTPPKYSVVSLGQTAPTRAITPDSRPSTVPATQNSKANNSKANSQPLLSV